jgi:AcrR family transcriptional regulator
LPTTGWRDLSYAQIVEAAGVSLAAAYQVYRSKLGVLGGFVREIDQQMLSTLEADPLDGTARDKLFDLIMRRLDLQQDNKAALDALLHDLSRSPADALCVADRLTRSMALMLEMAGIPTDSLRGFLRTQALVGLYLHVMRTWVKDESDDAAKTMALLDKRLDQAERLLGLLRPRRTAAAA